MVRSLFFLLTVSLFVSAHAQQKRGLRIANTKFSVQLAPQNATGFTYTIAGSNKSHAISFPAFEIDGRKTATVLMQVKQTGTPQKLKNRVTEYVFEGLFKNDATLKLKLFLQLPPHNAVLRFRYALENKNNKLLTKNNGADNLTYLSFTTPAQRIKEVRLSEFNERFHATHLTEYPLDEKYFENNASFMGPIAVSSGATHSFLAAYEHGSQYPDKFLEFRLGKNKNVALAAVKANYLTNSPADNFSTVWLQFAALAGNEDALATEYRKFVLHYITQNSESRRPYIFYNTWGRQERVQWTGQKYLASMNLDQTLKEIDKAHAMGIEVFVLDAGWFKKTGDWEVNKDFFPDSLRQVKKKLDSYGMKLGLWFNPVVAAVSSQMYQRNLSNRMSWNGSYNEPREIWETEGSQGMCLVSNYWEDFANKLISLTKELGVSYFKWDAIGQYGCNDARHLHGTEKNSDEERGARYAFLQPEYMAKIIDKVCKEAPQSIFDFDITEEGRCVGLQFLSAGKYFIINNGPYYHNFDLAPKWKSVLPSGNANIFVEPGPARGWFVRSVLDYDKWIPSVLFLTHYQPDEPRSSQVINVASLVLGQNGIWGELLKTSDSGTVFIGEVLDKYKTVRTDITEAPLVKTGEPGGNPEVYEKINKATGKGCVIIFAGSSGSYSYITQNKVTMDVWTNEGVTVKKDEKGRAVITVLFDEPSAKIIFFGANGPK